MTANVVEPQLLAPFYLICSSSSIESADTNRLYEFVRTLLSDLACDPIVSDLAAVSVIQFGSEPSTLVPLSCIDHIVLPRFTFAGKPVLSRMLKHYCQQFERDYVWARNEGRKMFRPWVFLVIDGDVDDSDEWESALDRLISWSPSAKSGNKFYPYVVAFGFRGADIDVLRQIAYPDFGSKRGRWYLLESESVDEIFDSISNVIECTISSIGHAYTLRQTPPPWLPPPPSTPWITEGEAGAGSE